MENLTSTEAALVTAVDTSYLLLTGMNILMMQAGFTALEAGGSRAKNVKSLLFKNFMDHAVGSLAWFTIGWGLYIGTNPFAAGPESTFFVHSLDQYAKIFQQFAFAATAATIVSGAVTGRCRLEPYVVLSALLSGVTYPIAAHWAWSDGGWLRQLGFLDFAGSQVVHGFGAAVALVAAWACGPRPGRFLDTDRRRKNSNRAGGQTASSSYGNPAVMAEGGDGSEAEQGSSTLVSMRSKYCIPSCPSEPQQRLSVRCPRPGLYKTRVVPKGHNPALMVLGALMLYFAWFSFNAGSAGSIYASPDSATRAAVNTMLAPGAASLASMVMAKMVRSKYDIEFASNAMLSGLVAITAGCGFVDPWAAVVVGLIATPVYAVSAWVVLHVLGVDDVLGAISVHGTCGALGTLWLGLTHPVEGLFYGGGPKLLGVQALGVVVIGLFAIVTTFILVLVPFQLLGKLSYSEAEQLIGIDLVHFGGEFGKDVDLESEGRDRRTSLHSELDSDGGRSNNSSFVEEFPDPTVTSSDHGGGGSSTHNTNNSKTSFSARANNATGTVELKDPSTRIMRTFSTNTVEGRRAVHSELRRVLDDDPRVRHRFRAYLEVMHREEGVAFWDEVVRWKAISSTSKKNGGAEKKVKEAKRIIKTYCLDTGTKQVNLASQLVKRLSAALDDRDELLNNKLFDDAMDELFRDLKLSFMEFVEQTPNYWM